MSRQSLSYIVIHHTAAEEKDAAQIKNYHITHGWADVAYDFIIEKDGKVVEGRPLTMKGGHTGVDYYNQNSIGVSVIGNLSKREIYLAQWNSLISLLNKLCENYNIPVDNILFHRDIKATACPGSTMDRDRVRKAVKCTLNKVNIVVDGKIYEPVEKITQRDGKVFVSIYDALNMIGASMNTPVHIRVLQDYFGKKVEYYAVTRTIKIS
jgi:N-acetyl-anhydromuramyl-L-alanine amidase AmpD